MTPVSEHLLELFESLVEGEGLSERQASEVALAADPTGRRLLAARDSWRQPPETAPLDDLTDRIMAGLPDLPPGGRAAVADLLLAAWADPEVRATIRQDPRGALALRGLSFADETAVVVVPATSGQLPSADRVELPLPVGQRPIPEAEARRRLAASELGWLWGPPWVRTAAGEPDVSSGVSSWRRFAPALAAGAAVVALAWLAALSLFPTGGLSGTAIDAPDGGSTGTGPATALAAAWPVLTLGAALALVVAWFWYRRR